MTPPPLPTEPLRQSLAERVSIVWLVPLGAVIVALGLVWQHYAGRGPLIEITLRDAAGIVARQTQLRYRDVPVGLVETLDFTPDLTRVVVGVRLDPAVAPHVDADAQFWVVRPQVSTRGITGLDTVLSGVYLQGSWDAVPGAAQSRFAGLDEAPIALPGTPGTRIVLRSDGRRGLAEGMALLYKGLEVGRVGRPRLSPDGHSIEAEAFVAAPHDLLLSAQSRFWNVSGMRLRLDAGGASAEFDSLAALVAGGITFETLVAGGGRVVPGTVFDVFDSQDAALSDLFSPTDPARLVRFSVLFEQTLPGLAVGAPVSLGGLDVGEVAGLSGLVDRARFGDGRMRLLVVLAIDSARIDTSGPGAVDDPARDPGAEVVDFLARRVAEGLRARLSGGALLGGGLRVELVDLPDSAPGMLNLAALPYPSIPAAPARVQDLAGVVSGLLARIEALPVEEVLTSARAFLDEGQGLLADPDLRGLARRFAALSDEAQALVADLRASGMIDAAGATLAATEEAGTLLARRLPGLADQSAAVLVQADRVLAGLAEGGTLSRDARTALQEIARAAEAVRALARLIERKPNALVTGR